MNFTYMALYLIQFLFYIYALQKKTA